MARTVSVRTTIVGGETLERNIKLRYGSIVRNQMESVGKQMVANANALMAGDFDLNRPTNAAATPARDGRRRRSTTSSAATTTASRSASGCSAARTCSSAS
jgi:hypothetical protein